MKNNNRDLERQIQESLDMANRAGDLERAARSLEFSKSRARKAEHLNETLLNWIIAIVTICMAFCLAMTWLLAKTMLPQ